MIIIFPVQVSMETEIIFPKNLFCSLSISPMCISMDILVFLHNIKHVIPNNCEGRFTLYFDFIFVLNGEKKKTCDVLLETLSPPNFGRVRKMKFPMFSLFTLSGFLYVTVPPESVPSCWLQSLSDIYFVHF